LHECGYVMRGPIAIITLLIGLVVLTPFACASTYEVWTDGVYDAELDGDVLALLSLHAVIDRIILTDRRGIELVVAVVVLADDTVGDLADPSTRSGRAPPTA
jgi:hypothetical protein